MHSFKMCSGAMVTNKVNNLGAEAGGTFELTQQLGSSKPREQQGNAAPGQGGPAAGTGTDGSPGVALTRDISSLDQGCVVALAHLLVMGDAQSTARDPAVGTCGSSLPATVASPMGPPWGLRVPGSICSGACPDLLCTCV